MDFKFQCNDSPRNFPCKSSLLTHRRLHCKRCPAKGSVLAIRKWDDKGRFYWHLATVSRVNSRKQMRVFVVYFDGELYESLNLNKEQWGLEAGPTQVAPSPTGTAADKIVRQVDVTLRMRILETYCSCAAQTKQHSIQDAFKNHGTEYRRRGPHTVGQYSTGHERPSVGLAGHRDVADLSMGRVQIRHI